MLLQLSWLFNIPLQKQLSYILEQKQISTDLLQYYYDAFDEPMMMEAANRIKNLHSI